LASGWRSVAAIGWNNLPVLRDQTVLETVDVDDRDR
jgi:hypothetical protein